MSPARCVELAPPDAQGNVSFADLSHAARRLGLHAEGRFLSFASLGALDGPAILNLDEQHFVAFLRMDRGDPVIVDAKVFGDIRPEIWSPARLKEHWTGKALVIGPRRD